jgi:hypothetical protein
MSSSTDKTRQMLVNSMVKTKAGTTDNTSNKPAAQSTAKTAVKKQTAKKKAASGAPATRKKVAAKPAVKSQPSADPYQSKGRIWPD